jgi:DNA mismatch repair protein MutL
MLLLVDQHRAHERVLYERLAAAHPSADDTVPLPEPLVIDVRPAYRDRFARWLDELAAYGFQAEPFGPRSFLVRTVPALPGVVAGPPELQDLGQPAALAPALLPCSRNQRTHGTTRAGAIACSFSSLAGWPYGVGDH